MPFWINEKEDDDPQDKAEQQEGEGEAEDTDDNTTDIIITDEYLHKRQQASRRTMLVIRIIFLISAVLVIIFSIKLVVDGYRGINGIFDSIHRAIDFIADHIESIKTEVDNYIEVNQLVAFSGFGEDIHATTLDAAVSFGKKNQFQIKLN